MSQVYRLSDIGLAVPGGTRVIKSATVASVDEAEIIIDAARARAAEIVAESEAIYEARRIEGYRDGLAEAARETLAETVATQAELDAALKTIEGRLSALVVNCVASILGEAADVDLAESLTRTALTKMRQEERAQLFVPMDLVEPMRARIDAILATFPEVELLDVVGDASLSAPTVVLQSGLGRVRCNLDDTLAELDATIRGALGDLSPSEPHHGPTSVSGAIEVNPSAPQEDTP